MPKKSFKPQKTGVSFHPIVLKFLDTLVLEEGTTRSEMLTRIVKFYAEQHGRPLDLSAAEARDSPELKRVP